jgi:hypothetical protein
MRFPILKILNPAIDLHAGLSTSDGEFHYVLLAKKDGKAPEVLMRKKGPVSSLKIPLSIPVNAVLPDVPALLVHDAFAPHTPEEWIDQNEGKIIPRGCTSSDIINEWCVIDNEIYSGTITKKSHESAFENFSKSKFTVSSLSLPLWDLVRLYGHYLTTPFIIWKMSADGSVLGYSSKGKLCALCNFWAGYNDLAGDQIKIINEALALAKSISPPDQPAPIMVYCPKKSFSIPDSMKNTPQLFLDPPVVPGLSLDSHEAFASANHEDTHLDFADFNHVQQARTLTASRKRALIILRIVSGIMLIGAFALLGLKGAGTVSEKYLNGKMKPIRKYIEQYKTEQGRLDLLTGEMKKKTQFVSQKSQITNALTEMQTAFPEGVWAEQISFTEGASDWTIAIVAFSNNSASIPLLLKNIAGIKGMTGIRMVYSEQTSIRDKTGEKAIKFRLEGEWGK